MLVGSSSACNTGKMQQQTMTESNNLDLEDARKLCSKEETQPLVAKLIMGCFIRKFAAKHAKMSASFAKLSKRTHAHTCGDKHHGESLIQLWSECLEYRNYL